MIATAAPAIADALTARQAGHVSITGVHAYCRQYIDKAKRELHSPGYGEPSLGG